MRSRKTILLLLFSFVSSLIISNTMLSAPASAATKKGSTLKTVYQKSIAWAINTCYTNGSMKNYFVPGNFTDTPMMANILTDKGKNQYTAFTPTLPNTENPIVVGKTTCGLLFGSELLSKYYSTSIESVGISQLPSIGYEKESESTFNRNCIGFKYLAASSASTETTYITPRACFKVNKNNGSVASFLGLDFPSAVENGTPSLLIPTVFGSNFSFTNGTASLNVSFAGKTWSAFTSEVRTHFSDTLLKPVDNGIVTTSRLDQSFATYSKQDNAVNKALKYFTKSTYTNINASKLLFKDKDRLTLYMNYINYMLSQDNALKYRENQCGGKSKKEDLLKETGYLYHKSQNKWCVLDGVDQITGSFSGIKSDGEGMKDVSFADIVKEMQKDKYNSYKTPKLSADAAAEASTDDNGDDDEEDGEQPTCYNSAESLGWILCPALSLAGTGVEGLYGVIKTSFLEIDAPTLLGGGQNSLRDAWANFRDYANVIFIIMLAIVIFSQLTGVGVSNYGIKKILPRLIVMVILVNVSFVICQLAVDLSNILGNGFESMFTDAADKVKLTPPIGQELGPTELGESVGAITTRLVSTATTGALLIGGISIAVSTWEFWLIPLALFFLGCFIGVLFFAIILGVREAGIIVLIALAPVAVVCYALPNTKKLFDKWFKLFSSLLLVFPICGILMGGGIWVSKLMLATGQGRSGITGFFFALVAMLMQVVPFFLVPTLVKGSLAAAGQIGAKIAGFGDNLGRAAKGSIRNSDRYKDTQERLAGNRGQRMLNRDARLRKRDERSAEFRANHRILGMLRHPGGTFRNTQMGQNGRNRRLNRANQAVLAASLNNRDRSDYFEQRQVDELAGDYSSAWQKQGILDDDKQVASQVRGALADLHEDANNIDAKARFTAGMKKLMQSGPERKKLRRELESAVGRNGGKVSDGLRWAMSATKDELAPKKDNALEMFKNVTAMSNPNSEDFGKMSFAKIKDGNGKVMKDEDGNELWVSHSFASGAAGEIGASQIGKMDKPELENYISALKNNELDPKDATKLIAAAHEANDNPNISVDGDKQELVDSIASMSYTHPMVGDNDSVSSVDSSTMNIMARSSQAELTRMANYASNGKTKGQELKQLANVAEATLRGANTGKVNLSAEKAEQLNRILAADKRKTIPYSLRVDHSNPAPPPPSGYHDTGTGSGIIIPN